MRKQKKASIHLTYVLIFWLSYFYGLPWSKHIVIYDTLIKDSTTDEVVAVLGKPFIERHICFY